MLMSLTFMEAEDGQRDIMCPGTVFRQADAVPRATKQLPSCHQVAVIGRLVL